MNARAKRKCASVILLARIQRAASSVHVWWGSFTRVKIVVMSTNVRANLVPLGQYARTRKAVTSAYATVAL